MNATSIILLVFGTILSLVALCLLIIGGNYIWIDQAANNGYVYKDVTNPVFLKSSSYAIIARPDVILHVMSWWELSEATAIKVKASSTQSSFSEDDHFKDVFIGIASDSEVENYLNDVAHDEITKLIKKCDQDEIAKYEEYLNRADYINKPGISTPADPSSQIFWEVSAYGTGEQTIEWETDGNTWILVLMNTDRSANASFKVYISYKAHWFWIGILFVIGGVIAMITSLILIYYAVLRKTRSNELSKKAILQ